MAEADSGIRRLQDCKAVKGTLILDSVDARIIETHGEVFEGEQGKKYGKACRNIVAAIKDNLGEVDATEAVSGSAATIHS